MPFDDNSVVEVEFSKPQLDFIMSSDKFPAFVGGFGSGKTEALVARALVAKQRNPTCDIAVYLPTFDLISTISQPRFESKLEAWGCKYKSIKSQRPNIEIADGGKIIFRTMVNPERIIGYEVADSFVDELDTLQQKKAEDVWHKIVARNRQKKPNGEPNTISVATTPEGFRFVYSQWAKQEDAENKGYKLIKASTYDNMKFLPEDYIQNLLDLYPANLVAAYIHGEFVNMTSGSVYPMFDRVLNHCDDTVGTVTLPNGTVIAEDLHIGMDFNVTNMTATINVRRGQWPATVDEITKVFDTPAMIEALKTKYPHNRKIIYPDASGNARKSQNASETDINLLQAAGFIVLNDNRNPFVKDRVLAMNGMICNANNVRRWKVNTNACPVLTSCLEQQAYDPKTGEPDKKSGLDHPLDAQGYFISYCFPIRGDLLRRAVLTGV